MLVPAPPFIKEVEEAVHDVVVPSIAAPYVIADEPGSGTVGIGLTPLVPVSVAPSEIALPITLTLEVEAWAGLLPLVDALVQPELDDDMPPPSKVKEVDNLLIPLAEPVALQVGSGAGPRPLGLISIASSGMPVSFEPFIRLMPIVPSGEVAPIPDGLTAVCALLDAQAQKSVKAAIKNCRIDISCAALGRQPWCQGRT